jgi:hypothetical protein
VNVRLETLEILVALAWPEDRRRRRIKRQPAASIAAARLDAEHGESLRRATEAARACESSGARP